jgi:spoIIIJ-associated protein
VNPDIMTEHSSFEERVAGFTETLLQDMGLDLSVSLETMADGFRINLTGDDAEFMLRRRGEGLDALQHVVNSVFRDEVPGEQRLVLDCQGFRQAKDRELQQMARFLMERARSTGMPQELGPLNSYARRLVHLEVSSAPDLLSQSHGEGAMKLVVISRK